LITLVRPHPPYRAEVIRDRRPEDLDRLADVVLGLDLSATGRQEPRAWLQVVGAVVSWVYDMAPAHVAPTRNVVGHVVVYRPDAGSPTPRLSDAFGRPPDELLAIGRLCVRPQKHAHGIARHLLREARLHVQRLGKVPVLDIAANGSLSPEFCARYGFVEVPAPDPGSTPMVWTP